MLDVFLVSCHGYSNPSVRMGRKIYISTILREYQKYFFSGCVRFCNSNKVTLRKNKYLISRALVDSVTISTKKLPVYKTWDSRVETGQYSKRTLLE